MARLSAEGFIPQTKVDDNDRLTAIFFAHLGAVVCLQRNPDVLLLDCTYKLSKHYWPFLDIVEVDSYQHFFLHCLCLPLR